MDGRKTDYFRELEHAADWSILVWAEDVTGLFENAAAAMFELQHADMVAEPSSPVRVACLDGDVEALLIQWLSELLYLSELNDVLYTRFDVDIQPDPEGLRLTATAWGLPGRGPMAHVKAVTYYDLQVIQATSGWEATITFDT